MSQMGIQMFASGFAMFIFGLVFEDISNCRFTFSALGALMYLVIFACLVGFSCYIYCLQKWSATRVKTYTYINTIVAVVLGAIILKESISSYTIMIMIIILVGVMLVQFSKLKNIENVL